MRGVGNNYQHGELDSLLPPKHSSSPPDLPPDLLLSLNSAQSIDTTSSTNKAIHSFFSLTFVDKPILSAWGVKDVNLCFAADPSSRQARRRVLVRSGALVRASDQRALMHARTSLVRVTRQCNTRMYISR